MRQAYIQAGTPEEEWAVSSGPRDRRDYHLEPNIGWLIDVYEDAELHVDRNERARIATWRSQAHY